MHELSAAALHHNVNVEMFAKQQYSSARLSRACVSSAFARQPWGEGDAAAVQHKIAPPAKREGFFSRVVRRLFLALALACALGASRGFFVHGVEALLHKLQQLYFYGATILHGQQLHGGGKRGGKFQKIQDEPASG